MYVHKKYAHTLDYKSRIGDELAIVNDSELGQRRTNIESELLPQ